MEGPHSPDAHLRLAPLRLARLRLNDGAKLWVSFKLCFKTNPIAVTYRPSQFVPCSTMSRDIVERGTNWLGLLVNFGARKVTKSMARYEPVSRV